MKYFDPKPGFFDQHRKDHTGRAMILPVALLISGLLWLGIIAAVARFL